MDAHLEKMRARFEHIGILLSDPVVIRDQARFQTLARERSELEPVVEAYDRFLKARSAMTDARQMMEADEDPELVAMARDEVRSLEAELAVLEGELRRLMVPRDPLDAKNIILEIRAGAGGDEASLFAGDLLRMYERYAEGRRWKMSLLSAQTNDVGGFKEVITEISGRDVYSRMKYESGVHRVQRIPVTEAGGRIHTSTVTVAVLPEAEEVEVKLAEKDLRVDVYRSSGHGGQSVNTTDSAVRVTHLPTGMVVCCQDGKSQIKNKAQAMKILASRLLEEERSRAHAERAANRRGQVGTGERSERIRTYNFAQGRLSDHRIGLTLYRLPEILEGDLDEVIEALAMADQEAKLKALQEEGS